MNSQRVTMVTLSVTNLAVSRKYYETLGWKEAEGGNDSIAFYILQGQFLALYLREALEKDIGQSVAAPATGSVTLATNYPDTDAVDAAFAAAVAAGATEVVKPEKIFWGGYSGSVSDPDGHLWEFAHNPFWSLDKSGHIDHDT